MRILKTIRAAVAVFFIAAISLLFMDFTGTLHPFLNWTTSVQLVPAILAFNVGALAFLIILTLLFGRVYCSAICPLGILQDGAARIFGFLRSENKGKYSYRPSQKTLVILRFAILAAFVLSFIFGVALITVKLEPYSIFGRIVSQTLTPLYLLGNNILAYFAERAGSFAFYSVEIYLKSGLTLAVAVSSLLAVAFIAAKTGRGYCNTICPVGAFLAIITKYCSFVKAPIDKEKCNACGVCAKNCKAACIDSANKEIDYLRCVSCCNCMAVCPKGAIKYKLGIKNGNSAAPEPNEDIAPRRNFIALAAVFTLGLSDRILARTGFNFDGGLAPLLDKKTPPRTQEIIPAGADDVRTFRRLCTACQKCVSVCQNKVLRPSKDIGRFMQPHLSFERGFCQTTCNRCSQICPTNAIRPISREEKSSIQIGYAVWQKDLCVINRDGVSCNLCQRRCPTGAITLVPKDPNDPTSLNIPSIDVGRCIGCGACEFFCPSRPISAIYVEGLAAHREI